MEQWRLFVAIFLSILVFAIWQHFFAPKQEIETTTAPEGKANGEVKPGTPIGPPPASEGKTIDSSIKEGSPGGIFGIKTIHSPLYTATISAKGAALTSFILEKYKESLDNQNGGKQLIPSSNAVGTALVKIDGKDMPDLSQVVFTSDFTGETMEVNENSRSMAFFSQPVPGLVIEKKYIFDPNSYKIDLEISIRNASLQPQNGSVVLSLINPAPGKGSSSGFEGPCAYINDKLEQIPVKEFDKKGTLAGKIDWAGIETQYFMSAAIPEALSGNSVRFRFSNEKNLVEVQLCRETQIFQPETAYSFVYKLFLGPKRMPDLKAAGGNLDKAMNFGYFDIIAKPCLWLMNFIHDRVVSNYGVCIIILTVFFKIIFWPLGTKSYRSMAEMKKLQPLMEEIRKKYKNDKKKMNEEIMGLYRTYKVNPMSGCLPMVVQIPVFIAFYRMLYGAIELRHAPFALWINDLSAPDRLFHFNFSIPMMTPPYGIPVLTIIMGATMLLQQKLSPPPGDPAQARMMMMMPIVFTFIFINFPSGLVLYWLVNNILSIAQQYYITKKTVQ